MDGRANEGASELVTENISNTVCLSQCTHWLMKLHNYSIHFGCLIQPYILELQDDNQTCSLRHTRDGTHGQLTITLWFKHIGSVGASAFE